MGIPYWKPPQHNQDHVHKRRRTNRGASVVPDPSVQTDMTRPLNLRTTSLRRRNAIHRSSRQAQQLQRLESIAHQPLQQLAVQQPAHFYTATPPPLPPPPSLDSRQFYSQVRNPPLLGNNGRTELRRSRSMRGFRPSPNRYTISDNENEEAPTQFDNFRQAPLRPWWRSEPEPGHPPPLMTMRQVHFDTPDMPQAESSADDERERVLYAQGVAEMHRVRDQIVNAREQQQQQQQQQQQPSSDAEN